MLAEENGTAAFTLTTGVVFFFFFFFLATAGEAMPRASSAASTARPITQTRVRKRAFSLPRMAAIPIHSDRYYSRKSGLKSPQT